MANYEVRLAPAAVREVKKLSRPDQRRVVKTLEKVEKNSRPPGVEKLSQDPRFWRIKSGDYRIIYAIEDDSNIVVVVVVRHRKEAYRNLDQLDSRLVAATVSKILSDVADIAKPN